MKKLTLLKAFFLLCALVVGSSSAWAQEVTLDFTNAGTVWGIPTSGTNKTRASFTNGTYTIYLYSTTNYKANSGYLILGKKNSYMELPAFTFDVEKIEVVGHKGASGSVEQNIYVGTNAVSTKTTGANDVTNSYTITSGYETAGTVYKLMIVSDHNTQIDYVKIYKKTSGGGGTTVATPSFNNGTGTYTSAQSITLNCGTNGATIHYTITEDGTTPADPTESDATYSSAISVTKSGTKIKAKAFKSGMTASSVASATYTIKPNTPTITAAGATVTISGDDGLSFYYTTDNSNPTIESTAYTGPFELDADCTIKAIACDAYGNTSGYKSLAYKYMPLNPKNINSGYYEKVTDVSTLENGDAILIVNEDAMKAMSTTQGNNNRPCEDITISNSSIYAPSADVQKLILVKKKETIGEVETDVFYFYTGSLGYLYAASSSSNHLKTEETPDNNNNARATISFDNGNAIITFTGTSTRNVMQFNSTLFSCYSSASQSPIEIYKEVAKNESATITAAEYATFNSAYALDFSETGITVYTAQDKETSVGLTEITSGQVPANTPVVLYKEGANGTAINVPVIASADAVGDNDLAVKDDGADVENMYVLANGSKGVGFYPWKGSKLNAGKVYLQGKASYARDFLGFNEGGTTAIDNVVVKTIDDNAPMYNLAGQRVTKSYKGVVIVNGKKMLNK